MLFRSAGFSGHGAMFGPFSAAVGLALAEAGRDVATVSVLGQDVRLDAFRLDRVFSHGERLVI